MPPGIWAGIAAPCQFLSRRCAAPTLRDASDAATLLGKRILSLTVLEAIENNGVIRDVTGEDPAMVLGGIRKDAGVVRDITGEGVGAIKEMIRRTSGIVEADSMPANRASRFRGTIRDVSTMTKSEIAAAGL